MATIYLDTSAVVKRALPEAQSAGFVDAIELALSAGGVLVTSALTQVETGRALRRRPEHLAIGVEAAFREALQGIAVAPITGVVVELARTADPPLLRSLDAIHLATAVALSCDELWTYDERLAEAARGAGMTARAPV